MAAEKVTKAAPTAPNADKKRAIETAMAQIEKLYGKGSIMRCGDEQAANVEAISTGSLALDLALGIGGLPKGRIVEIYGPESSGKTTLALHVLAQAQKAGGEVAFIDAEHALDITYARALGVKVEDMLVSQPDTGEQALEITEALVRSGAIDVIVVDSVAALVPRAEIEGEMGDSFVGLHARLMSQALRKLAGAINKTNCIVIFINQLREKLGMEMPTTPEEFKDLLIAIKETDLNENGENDEIPLMGYYNGRKSDPICFLMNPFELYTDNYYTITDDGQIAFHANTDGWREGLKYIADLYANGLIAEETYVQDKTQFQAILNKPSDDAVIGVMPIWYQGDVIDANVLNWVDYEPIAPLKGDDGTQQSAARFGGNFNMVGAISTKCENPEIAFKFLDWFIGEEGTYVGHYGVEGKDWEWVDSKSFFGGDKSISRLVPDIEALWNSGSFPRADKAEIRYATTMDPEKIYTDNTYALVHAAQTYEPYYVNHHIPDVVWCTDEDVKTKVANYSTTINDYVKSTDTQFIMGQLDINDDEAWNAYLKGLNDRGLEDYLENLAVYYGLE